MDLREMVLSTSRARYGGLVLRLVSLCDFPQMALVANPCTVVVGEICNFAAYAFAPAILVTPLGALSVLIGAVLGSYFLREELGTLGRLGSAICLIGAVIIVLHAPPDEDIQTIDQILHYAIQPGESRCRPEPALRLKLTRYQASCCTPSRSLFSQLS